MSQSHMSQSPIFGWLVLKNAGLNLKIANSNGLKLRTTDEPGGVAGGVPLVVNKGEVAVYVLQFHQYHGARTVVATTRNEALAMRVHHHEHASQGVCQNLTVVARTIQNGIGTLGSEDRLGLAPSRKKIL